MYIVCSESRCALRLRKIWFSVSKLPLKCAVVRLKYNTGKVCNRLIQFLLIVVLSIEERVFISAQGLSERTVRVNLYGVSAKKILRSGTFWLSSVRHFRSLPFRL
jgi:hypothetical protein